MPRKMVVQLPDGSSPLLTEETADEAQLQELVKRLPDLIPIEEFGMAGSMMVVGRETRLPSGAVDLLGLTQAGEILVIEFKTGPQNPDFRHALSQLLDYGSDLWEMSYEEFENRVPLQYFANGKCEDPRTNGSPSLADAVAQVWPDSSAEDHIEFQETLTKRLANGHFDYVLIAQRFTPPMLKTMEYMNESMPGSRFYAVEIVKFGTESLAAYETRTILKPSGRKRPEPGTKVTESSFLDKIDDEEYRAALQRIFLECRDIGLTFEWGALGTSIRVQVKDGEPISLAWLFPPGELGYLGLTDVTLGYVLAQSQKVPEAQSGLESYLQAVASLPGATRARPEGIEGYSFEPEAVVGGVGAIVKALVELAEEMMGYEAR